MLLTITQHEQAIFFPASAPVEAAAASDEAVAKLNGLGMLQHIIWQLDNLYRTGNLPAGVNVNISVTDILTREVKFQLEPQYVNLVAPEGETFALPVKMVEELRLDLKPSDVVTTIEKFRAADESVLKIAENKDFHALCAKITGRDMNPGSISRTLYNHDLKREMAR